MHAALKFSAYDLLGSKHMQPYKFGDDVQVIEIARWSNF